MGLFRSVARARLASQVLRRLRRAGVPDARYHRASFTVHATRPGDGEPSVLRLDEVVRGRAAEFVTAFLRAPGLPATWAQARPLLRPVLRGAVPPAEVGAPLSRPAFPFLAEYVVVDQPDTMTYVNAAHGWGVTDDEVFAAARANLSGATLVGAADEPVVVQFVDDGDSYWTSHLLLDGWLAGLAGQVGGRPVAFAPERGTLLVTADGSDLLPGLFAQAEAAFLASPRAITPMAYVSDERGRTVPYPGSPGSPLEVCVRRAEAVLAARAYERQAESLPLAAELLITSHGRTRAVWASDGPALLPRADEVQYGDTVKPWDEVEPHLIAQGLNPERWRAEKWPV
ncbi:hypothetical protein COUCH_31900 [Couchioplanes caeruleus]|uniref:hypothetical protein n=1 Tax=Couchioplanes caeruleus TaxID=56438 RepID=UPI0020BD57D6|nr:hypothetical protein [Couchioplanes caeruleus]UQU63567.1 hypothetical protein COUCH_31900 [Couchioplanes caeruleus]